MAVSTFYLRGKSRAFAKNVVFKAGKTADRLDDFFVSGKSAPKTPYLPPILGSMQEGVPIKKLLKMDYLPSFGGIPIFSLRFVEQMSKQLADEAEFFDCKVFCDGTSTTFFVAKLLRRMHLLEYEKSGVFRDEITFLRNVVRTDLASSFWIAREEHPLKCYVFVVSEQFRVEALRLGLQMDFDPTNPINPSERTPQN